MPVLNWPDDAAALRAHVAGGGVFAYPTEAVFGLGGHPGMAKAADAVLRLKEGRSAARGMLLVAGSPAEAQGFVRDVREEDWRAMQAAQEIRATTFLLSAGDEVCAQAVVDGKVALRLSRHPVVCAMTRFFGHPLLSTSANRHRAAPARNVAEVLDFFSDVWIVDAPCGNAQAPSRIVDWESGRVIRE